MPAKKPPFSQKEQLPRWFFTINRFWILILFSILLGAISLQYTSKALTPISSDILYRCTNAVRQENKQPKLYLNEQLNQAAEKKLADMEQYDYWAHQNPTTGKQPWEFIDETGYYYETAGENLAIGYQLSEEICDAWQKSPSHFANLVNPNFQEVGFAYQAVKLDGQRSGILVVQMFGTREGFEKNTIAREKCSNRMKNEVLVLYPNCGIIENNDPVMILYNPKSHQLAIKLDGMEVSATVSIYGDYYRYEFSRPFALGSHQLEISPNDSTLQAARLKFIVTSEQEKVISQNINQSISASILSTQNTSKYAVVLFLMALASLGYFFMGREKS